VFHYLCVLYSLFTRLATHVVQMLRVIKESQENAEIMRRNVAHGSFLLGKGNTDEMHAPKQRQQLLQLVTVIQES